MFFETTKEDAGEEYSLMPEGTYRVAVIDTAYKSTKKGDGRYVSVAFQVLDGTYKDRRVFANFNIENPSAKAQQIGKAQFKRFLVAIGIDKDLASENDFHRGAANKTLWVAVDQQMGSDGKTRNTVAGFKVNGDIQVSTKAPSVKSEKPKADPTLDDIPF